MHYKYKYTAVAAENIPLNCFTCKSVAFVTTNEFQSGPLLLIYNETLMHIFKCCTGVTIKLEQEVLVSDKALNKSVFQAGPNIYKIATDGSLYRLLVTTSSSSDAEIFGFGGTGSKSYSWVAISVPVLNDVVIATGSGQTSVMAHSSDPLHGNKDWFISFYDMQSQPVKIFTKLIENGYESDQAWYLRIFPAREFTSAFLKFFISSAIVVEPDILLMAQPNGVVSLLPLLSDVSDTTPVPIHYDNSNVLCIDTTPCREGLVCIHATGKIVCAYFSVKLAKMEYVTHHLSSCVTSAALHKSGSKFSVIWSDGQSVFYTTPKSASDFSNVEKSLSLKGIIKLLPMERNILAISNNGCFYEISVDDDESDLTSDESAIVSTDAITKVGEEVEDLQLNINVLNNQINALLVEQISPSEMLVKFVKCSLIIENLSSHCLSKLTWCIKVDFSGNCHHLVKYLSLTEDFEPQQSISFALNNILELRDWSLLSVSLVGHLRSQTRQLICNLANISLESFKYSNYATQTLMDIFKQF